MPSWERHLDRELDRGTPAAASGNDAQGDRESDGAPNVHLAHPGNSSSVKSTMMCP